MFFTFELLINDNVFFINPFETTDNIALLIYKYIIILTDNIIIIY